MDEGYISNVRTVDVIEVNEKENEISFVDSKIDTKRNLFISILFKGIQELNKKINLLESRINILEANK